MKALTERDLREELGWKQVESYTIEPGTLVTPSARQFLNERKIELIVKGKQGAEHGPGPDSKPMAEDPGRRGTEEPAPFKPRFVGPDGGMFAVKPEHLTHLHSNVLVTKGHPRIAFRGKMDSLQAAILEVQGLAAEQGNMALAEELEEILEFVRRILTFEVMEKPLPDENLLGLSLDELRYMSHNPKKHFGLGHIRTHYSMGRCCIGLNRLRAQVREVELAAFRAFERPGGVDREDVIRALNRLSSTIYVLMYRHLPKGYDRQYGVTVGKD